MNEERTAIYRLVPTAPASDPRWDIAPYMGTLVVRARSPADARIVAAEAETDFPQADAKPGDGVVAAFASAVRDDKLYKAVADESGRYPDNGPRAVLARMHGGDAAIKA